MTDNMLWQHGYMLSLNSERWSTLQHAYGNASDVPNLLRALIIDPRLPGDGKAWTSLWSSLAHQGDVYSASLAAVPHIVHIAAKHPDVISENYFHFVSWIDICRRNKSVAVPDDLQENYLKAIRFLPYAVFSTLSRTWDESFMRSALMAIAVGKEQHDLADALSELSPEVLPPFFEWLRER